MTWFAWSIATIALWGLWGFLAKLALGQLRWQDMLIVASAAYTVLYLVFAGIMFAIFRPTLAVSGQGAVLAFAAAFAGFAGIITFYLALNAGSPAIVVPLTAVYPVLTVVLSLVLLGESLTLSQAVAVVLFLIATVLVSR